MTHRRFARSVFGSLLVLLPVFLSAGPWDPNLPRPAGFQQTLGYLADDFYNYPDAQLQSIRGKLLSQDVVTGIVAGFKNAGIPPANWEAEGQKAFDAYMIQYESLKTLIRQTMNNPEGIIQAVEGNQPLPAELAGHPNVRGLIMTRWQMINVGEMTYQALIHAGLLPGGGSGGRPPPRPQDVVPPKPSKSKNQIDWERTRETWRRAIEQRRAFEAKLAEKNRKRLAEILELTRYLQNQGAISTNKFKSTRLGAGSSGSASLVEPESEPQASESAAPEPTVTESAPEANAQSNSSIEAIQTLGNTLDQLREKIEAEGGTKPEPSKVKVYRGKMIFRRPSGLDATPWQSLKDGVIAGYAQTPWLSAMENNGDEVTWRYKLLTAPTSNESFVFIPDGEPVEEEAEGELTPKKKDEEPEAEGNGDASPSDGTVVPGTERPVEETPKSTTKVAAKPAPKPALAKPAPKPEPEAEAKEVPGYWYDPTDISRSSAETFIYVRVDGQAVRVPLDEAEGYGVPKGASLETMTWYNERTGKIERNEKVATHRGSTRAKSTNRFAKPGN